MKNWEVILNIALWTPSPHNCQPWKFRLLDENRAELLIDRSRMLPKEDLTGAFILSAMGMMLESIAIIAANHQLRLDYKMTYEGGEGALIPFAELELTADEHARILYSDAIFLARRTSRLPYSKNFIPESDKAKFSQMAAEQGHKFDLTSDARQIKKILDYNISALFHDLNDRNYHDEIEGYFRYTDKHSRKLRDGLDQRCMNLPKHEFWISGKMPFLLKAPLFKSIFHWLYLKRLGPIANIGWLAGPFWKPEEACNAGRVLIHFWLEITKAGLYFHPFGNLVTNPEAAQNVKKELNEDNIWLIFKIGYSKEPPQSYRLPLQEIMID